MSPKAFNHFLKTLEEPGEGTVIMLLSENAESLLPTIRSRCVQLRLNPFGDVEENPALKDAAEFVRLAGEENRFFETGKITDDSLAFPVMQRVQAAVERFNRECRRDNFVHIRTVEKAEGEFTVIMGLDDEIGNLMTLELSAPNRTQAKALTKAFQDRAEIIYRMIMTELIDEPEHSDVTF